MHIPFRDLAPSSSLFHFADSALVRQLPGDRQLAFPKLHEQPLDVSSWKQVPGQGRVVAVIQAPGEVRWMGARRGQVAPMDACSTPNPSRHELRSRETGAASGEKGGWLFRDH